MGLVGFWGAVAYMAAPVCGMPNLIGLTKISSIFSFLFDYHVNVNGCNNRYESLWAIQYCNAGMVGIQA
jgi:hypothetical protein